MVLTLIAVCLVVLAFDALSEKELLPLAYAGEADGIEAISSGASVVSCGMFSKCLAVKVYK
jgi:hypothetical protein